MASCDRACESCRYGATCQESCREDRIAARVYAGGKRSSESEYNRMTDGKKTFIRYGHIRTASIWHLLRTRAMKANATDRTFTAGEIWDDTTDNIADTPGRKS